MSKDGQSIESKWSACRKFWSFFPPLDYDLWMKNFHIVAARSVPLSGSSLRRQTSWGEWEITEAIEHEKFSERNQFALEIIRIRKLINSLRLAGTVSRENVINHSHIFNYLTNLSPCGDRRQQSRKEKPTSHIFWDESPHFEEPSNLFH